MRIGDNIWYCHRIDKQNAEIEEFEEPIKDTLRMPSVISPIGITVQPKNGFTDRLAEGETTQSTQRVILQPYSYWNGKFKIGDLFYIDGVKPSADEDYYGQNANYMVENVALQNLAIELSLKKIIYK